MKLLKKVFFIFTPSVIGGIVALLIKNKINYDTLVKPIGAPPKLAFPIAWTIIYLLMGISYYLYKKNDLDDKDLNKLYYIQLFVNALWSIIFFIVRNYLLSSLWIILLDILVLLMLLKFYQNKKVSCYLNIPYMIWILFASYLTIGIYLLN